MDFGSACAGGGGLEKSAVESEMEMTAGELPAESYALPNLRAFSFANGRTGGRSGEDGAEDSSLPGSSSLD